MIAKEKIAITDNNSRLTNNNSHSTESTQRTEQKKCCECFQDQI
jgi:hypothetical protein